MVALLVFADGISLHWPGGVLRAPAWDEAVGDTLEALLTGHNLIRGWRHAGTTTMVATEGWLPANCAGCSRGSILPDRARRFCDGFPGWDLALRQRSRTVAPPP